MIKTTKEDKKMEVYGLIAQCLEDIKPRAGRVQKLSKNDYFDLFVESYNFAGDKIHYYLEQKGFESVEFKAGYNWIMKKEYSNGSMIKVSYTEGDIMIS